MDIPSIREYSDIVEQYSIDEAFVNMTASVSGDVLGLKRAVFVDQPIDHMSGGISREKRTVDYSKISVQ